MNWLRFITVQAVLLSAVICFAAMSRTRRARRKKPQFRGKPRRTGYRLVLHNLKKGFMSRPRNRSSPQGISGVSDRRRTKPARKAHRGGK